MKIILAILNVAVLLFIAYRVWNSEQSTLRKYFWPGLLLKWSAGIGLGLIYTYYYTIADTFAYFQDGVRLANVARTDFVTYLDFLWSGNDSFSFWSDLIYRQPRAMFMSKITSLFCLLTADNYWITSLYFSSLAFAGCWLLTRKIVALHSSVEFAAMFSFHFFPTTVFWSAGIIKESVAMACLFFLSVIFIKIWKNENVHWPELVISVLSLWILWNLKYYYLAIFLPVVFTTLTFRFLVSRFNLKKLWIEVTLWFVIFIVPLLMVSILHPNFYPERFMEVVVSSYYDFLALSDQADLIHYSSLEPTISSISRNAPWALFSGLFRPVITEANNLFQYFAAIENAMLLVLTLIALAQIKKLFESRYRILVFSILVYAVLLCVFLALSTPNFGTLSRYRVGFLPYLVLLLTVDNPLINKLMTLKIFRNLVP